MKSDTQNQDAKQESRFIVTCRLKPSEAFTGLEHQIVTSRDRKLTFQGDLLWVEFDAHSDDLINEMNRLDEFLRDFLSVMTLQVKHPLEYELLSYIEDRPRGETGIRHYEVGRLGPGPEPPIVTKKHVDDGMVTTILLDYCPHSRRAMLDYYAALLYAREAIVFCARSVEWVEKYFGNRDIMQKSLVIPQKYLTDFFKLANDTAIARHAGDPLNKFEPNLKDIEFAIKFNREVVLERFFLFLWHKLAREDATRVEYPDDWPPPDEQFKSWNSKLNEIMQPSPINNYPDGGTAYILAQ